MWSPVVNLSANDPERTGSASTTHVSYWVSILYTRRWNTNFRSVKFTHPRLWMRHTSSPLRIAKRWQYGSVVDIVFRHAIQRTFMVVDNVESAADVTRALWSCGDGCIAHRLPNLIMLCDGQRHQVWLYPKALLCEAQKAVTAYL